jgi:predicted Zn-dependent protease
VIGERLLDALAAALEGETGEVELSASAARVGATRFAASRVTQTGDVDEIVVQARVAEGGRLGAARTSALDRESLRAAIARAREIAAAQKNSPAAETPPPFDDGRAPAPSAAGDWDEATARAGAEDRARLIAPALARCAQDGLVAAGLAATGDGARAVATTRGARRVHRFTAARLDVIAGEPDPRSSASGRASRFAVSLAPVETAAAALADDAASRALRGRDPVELAPGAYDVILEPPAVAELIEWLALTSFGARTLDDGSSCLAGRAGQRLTGNVTIYDDALAGPAEEDGAPRAPFDAEGTPCRRVTFLDAGVAREGVHDLASALRAGVASTGHAAPLGADVFDSGPTAAHVFMAAGADDVPALLARVERGLWVSRFHYVNGLLDTRRALMTGMTRDGLFLVENGRVGRGVRNLRWTESLLAAFERLAGVTRERRVMAAHLSDSVFTCPTLLIRGWTFTGQSR